MTPDKRSDGQRPGDKIRDPQVYRMVQTIHIAWELLEIFSDHFRTPSKNFGDIEKEKDPQEQNRALM